MKQKFKTIWIALLILMLIFVAFLIPSAKDRISELVQARAATSLYSEKTLLGDMIVTDWSPDGTRLLGYRKDADGVFQVYTWDTNGKDEQMILVPSGLPGLSAECHKGFPHYGPNGDYIVLTVEMNFGCPKQYSEPGLASSTNLWIINTHTNAWTNLTKYPYPQNVTDLNGALSPYLSPDGTKVVWAKILEKADYANPRMIFGKWEVHVADISYVGGPRLTNDRVLNVGDGNIFEPHGFSPDSTKVLFSADIGLEYSAGLDIWEYNLVTDEMRNLTNSPTEYDEHARYSADGESIIWGSTQCCSSYNVRWFLGTLRSEAYTKRLDALQHASQLTRFNPTSWFDRKRDRTGNWTTAWSPDQTYVIDAQQTYGTSITWKSWKVRMP